MRNDDYDKDCASGPCFAHLLVDGHVVDPQTARDVGVFRKSERKRLYGLRKQVALEERAASSIRLARNLDKILDNFSGVSIAVYWPIRGELDLRNWMERCSNKGAKISLPVVMEKTKPIEFHAWYPDCKMRLGIWNIPIPLNEHSVAPDVVIVPLLGCDRNRFRLGNGGGYYDRTLPTLKCKPTVIGVGHPHSLIKTIYPMPWDIPMDKIVLSDGAIF